jgi:hypothetical protein
METLIHFNTKKEFSFKQAGEKLTRRVNVSTLNFLYYIAPVLISPRKCVVY